MDAAQTWTAALGALGIAATVAVALFTQVYQGRLQAGRDARAAGERRSERWEQERLATYKRFLDFQERSGVLRRGLGNDSYDERRREQTALLWEGTPLYAAVYLVAPPEVRHAVAFHDATVADASGAWADYWRLRDDDPRRPEALQILREANRAEGGARQAMVIAIRRDLGLEPEARRAVAP